MYEIKEEKPTPSESLSSVFASIGNFIFGSIESIVIALAFCVVIYLLVATPHEVVGRSMVPNFENGEFLLANKLVYKFFEPQRGDVIIFKHSDTQDYIKRIIGLPGDSVSLIDGKIYINNKVLDESEYLDKSVYTNGDNFLHEGETITVPKGQYFVCGDNRPHSSDSRYFGPITKDVIKGKALVVYFPFNHFRFVKHGEYK